MTSYGGGGSVGGGMAFTLIRVGLQDSLLSWGNRKRGEVGRLRGGSRKKIKVQNVRGEGARWEERCA